MDYELKKNFNLFDYEFSEAPLPSKYTGECSVSVRDGTDIENSVVKKPEIVKAVICKDDLQTLNPVFSYDRNSVVTGKENFSGFVNTYGLELLYDVEFGYDGYSFEVMYRNPRELQLWVDEGDGWKVVFDRYQVGHNEDKTVALKISFEEKSQGCKSNRYMMRRIKLRTTGWFGGIIRDKTCSVVKLIKRKAPLAVFEGSSITESCNGVSDFNAYSYARILSDIYGFDYLCLAQGGTGISVPTETRPSMYQRIEGVLKAEPDVLFIEAGINDKPDKNLKECTEKYLNEIRQNLPNTFVIMLGTYHPKYMPESLEERCEKDVITSSVCKKFGVPFVEFTTGNIYGGDGRLIEKMGMPLVTGSGTAFEPDGSGTSDRYTGKANVKDHCHCNPTAYRMFAEYIRSAFNAILNSMQ